MNLNCTTKLIINLFLLIILSSCSEHKDNNKIVLFQKDNFLSSNHLNAEFIDFDIPDNPWKFQVICDTIIMVENRDPCQFFLTFYGLNSKKKLANAAPKGKGPSEFLACRPYYEKNTDIIYAVDFIIGKICQLNIDSILKKQDPYKPKLCNYPREAIDVTYFSPDSLLVFNMYYLDNPKYGNAVKKIFKAPVKTKEKLKDKFPEMKYFPANVTGGRILVNRKKDKIAVPYFYDDKIEFYNSNLQLEKVLKGPDHFEIKYELRDQNMVLFGDKKWWDAYHYTAFYDDLYIYLLYVGHNGLEKNKEQITPTEIFKISWEGELIQRYMIDEHIISISVDKNREYIYATAVTSYKEYPKLAKYKID